MKDYHKAASCYKKACDLDPGNIGYRRNYELTVNNLQRINSQQEPEDEVRPHFMTTASRLINDPEITSVYAIIIKI